MTTEVTSFSSMEENQKKRKDKSMNNVKVEEKPSNLKWREETSVSIIYFSVTSDGTTGRNWITRLETLGVRVSNEARVLLRSPDFKPTSGLTTKIAVRKSTPLDDKDWWGIEEIRAEAGQRKLGKPEPEVACLIREKFTDEEIEVMGLSRILIMHEPIDDSYDDIDGDGGRCWFDLSRDGDVYSLDARWCACYYTYGNKYLRGTGFAFVVSSTCADKQTCPTE